MTRLTSVAVVVFGLLVLGRSAQAEGDVDKLVARGLELRRAGKTEEALKLFQEAHATAPSPRTFAQMGLAEASLQRWVDADTHLRAALLVSTDPWVQKNRGFLDDALRVTNQHVGELIVTGPAGTAVSVAGKPAGILPAIPPMRLAAGPVAITAASGGFKDFAKTVTISGGASASLAIALDPIPAPPPVAAPVVASPPPRALPPPSLRSTPAPEGRRPAWRAWTGATLGLAGAGALAWGITWLAVDGKDACTSCGTVYDTRKPGWILTGAGAAALAVGAIVLLTGSDAADSSVALGFGPGSALLRGRF